jgi:uncharacterized Fe-S cluster-containing protein
MSNYCHHCGTATGAHVAVTKEAVVKTKAKVKRKPSAYNKAYAKNYAKLKAKHPRSSFAALAKKSHTATRKGMK